MQAAVAAPVAMGHGRRRTQDTIDQLAQQDTENTTEHSAPSERESNTTMFNK